VAGSSAQLPHVLANDPATGYGIFIENMLDAVA